MTSGILRARFLICQMTRWNILKMNWIEISRCQFFSGKSFIRHVVLRKRVTLEDAGLLPRIGVDLHPDRELSAEVHQFNSLFEGKALRTSEDFRQAYAEARHFGKRLLKVAKAAAL